MSGQTKIWQRFLVAAAVLIIVAATAYNIPYVRVRSFAYFNGDKIEQAYKMYGSNMTVTGNVKMIQQTGEHNMVEFYLVTIGNTYYGCYYSPDGIPLPFQNADVTLTQDGHGLYTWHYEDGNHGSTYKLWDKWYYFKARFI